MESDDRPRYGQATDLVVILSYPIEKLRCRPFGGRRRDNDRHWSYSGVSLLWDASAAHMAIVPCRQGFIRVQKPQRQNPIGAKMTRLASDVGLLVFA